uniref:RPA43 OB domain-containing protein n=1 Tax=Anopheles culicifacies TaxID=139723 RepID=A0A182M1P8_9DIPT
MHRTTLAKYTKFSANELQQSLSDPQSCVVQVQLNEILNLRPRDCEHIVQGVRRCVTDKIGRHHPKLNGIVLGYAKIRIDNALTALRLDSPYLHVRATIDYYIFQPRIGSTLRGTVNYVSKRFVSAMIYRVFNVTVKLGKNSNKQLALNKGEEITFIVNSCDMKCEIPVIEGDLVTNGEIPVRIKQEPNAVESIGGTSEKTVTKEAETVDSTPPNVKQEPSPSKSKKSEKQKKPKKTTIVSNGTGSPDSDSSDVSDDEKSLLIKSLINDMFGDELGNGTSSKKHKKKKKKSTKKSSEDEPVVRVKEEPISTDEDSVDTSHVNGANGILTNGSSTSTIKKARTPEAVGKKRKIQFDLNATIASIKTEPTESKVTIADARKLENVNIYYRPADYICIASLRVNVNVKDQQYPVRKNTAVFWYCPDSPVHRHGCAAVSPSESFMQWYSMHRAHGIPDTFSIAVRKQSGA